MGVNAEIEVVRAMNGDDLKKGLGAVCDGAQTCVTVSASLRSLLSRKLVGSAASRR